MKKSHACIFLTLRYLHSFIFPVGNGNHFHFLLINLYCYLVISKFRIIAFFRRVLQILKMEMSSTYGKMSIKSVFYNRETMTLKYFDHHLSLLFFSYLC